MKILFSFFIFFLIIPGAFAKELYVAQNGNDSVAYADNNLERPWRTISYGVKTMQPGDNLYIREGNYVENVTISAGGTSESAYKTIRNYQNETPVLDAKNGARGINILNNVNYVKIIGLEIKNATDWGIASWYANSNSYITIQNCNIHDNGDGSGSNAKCEGGLAFHAESHKLTNILIDNNEIHHNYRIGIALFAPGGVTDDITISNNLIYRNPKNMLTEADVYPLYFEDIKGANVHNNYVYFAQKGPRIAINSNNNTFYNNVFAYSGWYGFDINASCSNNTIKNNILAYNGTGGSDPKDHNSDNNKFYNNIFYNNGYVGILQLNDTTGTQIQNNVFVGGLGYSAVSWESGSLGTHGYNNYYDLVGHAAVGGGQKYLTVDWIGSGKPEANSRNVNPSFVDVNYFNFSTTVSTLQNTGNNPSGDCDKIGLCSNFVDRTKVFPYIPLSAHSANYDSTGASKTIDHVVRIGLTANAWQSNSSAGWIKYEVLNGPKPIRYVGLIGGCMSFYYSAKDFHIAVSTTGTNDSDFTNVLDASYVDPSADDWSGMAQWFELPDSVNAKYIKLTIDNSQKDYSRATNPNVQVAEFYAIGPREGSESVKTTPPKTISAPTGLKLKDK